MPKKTTKKTSSKKTASKVSQSRKKSAAPVTPVIVSSETNSIVERFFQVVGDLRNESESKIFLLDFLTDSERMTFAKRLAIGLELQAGKSYEEVKKLYGVSSATISTVASMMKSAGMQLALKKVQTEKWADSMSKKFIKAFGVEDSE